MIPFSFTNFLNHWRLRSDKNNVRSRSPAQRQTAKIRGGRGHKIDQSSHVHYHDAPSEVPEIFVALYGDGSVPCFRGHIENRSAQMLVIKSIKICGEATGLNQAVSGMGALGIDELNFPPDLFTKHRDYIPVEVTYRTLDGRVSKYKMSGTQANRQAGGYNVEFREPPIIQSLDA